MEMTYDGALVMPSSYVAMDEDEMMYTDGGGTFKVKIASNSFVIGALSMIGGTLTTAKVARVLGGIGITIATAIELGTAGMGTLVAGAFILAWGGITSTIAGFAVNYGINALKGKTYKVASGWWCPNFTFSI